MTQVLESPAANPPAEPPDRARFQIGDLCVYLESYLSAEQIREVYRAFQFGAEAHAGQTRKSGEPYIQHPIAVARILAEMRMDHKCLMAAILHDVIEDTGHSKETVAALFDEEIAELVDGVSKLTRLDFRSKAEAQAANLQKMLLAMTKDIRVILIKLADRLHNMRTLGIMAPEKRRRISRETLEIYAPIANRLGIRKISVELEELGFAHCWPWRRLLLQRAVVRARGARKELVGDVEKALRERLEQEGIQGEVVGRQKHLYGIYGKMRDKQRPFEEVVDVFGFRVVVIGSIPAIASWVWCTTSTSLSPVASRTISPSPRIMAISPCIPSCSAPRASPSKSRFAPWTCSASPRVASRRTGCINPAPNVAARRTLRRIGWGICWRCSADRATR
jgi:guanosine-3',5'-bis(diphosphate) 3'-pyrophosphohydrolase